MQILSLRREQNPPVNEIGNPEDTTPASQLELSTKLTPAGKERVDSVVPYQRCLVENVYTSRAVQYAHCFPRKFGTDKKLLTKLEFYWNRPFRSLNLDTRYNIFRLGSSVHIMHDMNMWFFLPDQDVVERFHRLLTQGHDGRWKAVTGQALPYHDDEGKENKFKYRLQPMPGQMLDIPILRQDRPPAPGTAALPNMFTIHTHPFTTLPPLESHVHPKFVILETGRKLKELFKPSHNGYPPIDLGRLTHSLDTLTTFKNGLEQQYAAVEANRLHVFTELLPAAAPDDRQRGTELANRLIRLNDRLNELENQLPAINESIATVRRAMDSIQEGSILQQIGRIYEAWNREIPENSPGFPNDGGGGNDDDDDDGNDGDDDNDDAKTSPLRIPTRKRKRNDPPESPIVEMQSRASGSRKGGGGGHGQKREKDIPHHKSDFSECSLSGRTLHELDLGLGQQKWTKGLIASWSAGCLSDGSMNEDMIIV